MLSLIFNCYKMERECNAACRTLPSALERSLPPSWGPYSVTRDPPEPVGIMILY